MVSNRRSSLAVCAMSVGLIAGALGCSGGQEVTSTGGSPRTGTLAPRFAGTSIVAEPAGADAATAMGALIGPPPTPSTPSTTSTTTTAPPTTQGPVVTLPPVTRAPTTETPQTVTFTVPPTTLPPTLPPTTVPAKTPPIPLDLATLTPDEATILAALNVKKGGAPLILEQAATATTKIGTQKIAETKNQYTFPGSLFEYVKANYTQLTTGTFFATSIPMLASSASEGLAGTLASQKYVGLSIVTVNNNPWIMVILGS